MINIQAGWKAFFKPLSSKVGGCDCIEIKTCFQETIISLHISEGKEDSGLKKGGIPLVSLLNVSVEQNISSLQSIAQKKRCLEMVLENLCKYIVKSIFARVGFLVGWFCFCFLF